LACFQWKLRQPRCRLSGSHASPSRIRMIQAADSHEPGGKVASTWRNSHDPEAHQTAVVLKFDSHDPGKVTLVRSITLKRIRVRPNPGDNRLTVRSSHSADRVSIAVAVRQRHGVGAGRGGSWRHTSGSSRCSDSPLSWMSAGNVSHHDAARRANRAANGLDGFAATRSAASTFARSRSPARNAASIRVRSMTSRCA
jgi:hypothetical protein